MRKICTIIFFIASVFFAGNVLAGDLGYANLIMNGTIIAESCSVDVNSQYQNINLGNFPANTFTTVGDVTDAKSFNIVLLGCTQAMSNATITFSGTPDPTNSHLLALQDVASGSDMASGVAVQLLDHDMNEIVINTTQNVGSLKTGKNMLQYYLRYKATTIPVKSGNATAILYYDMSYQ